MTGDSPTANPPSTITLDDAVRLRTLPALEPLRALPRWIPWRWEAKADGGWTKVPFQAGQPELKAASNRKETWGPFEVALEAALRTDAAGVGIVITASKLTALDLDHCIDDAGNLAPWAQAIIGACAGCYCERTPSGHGLRVLGFSGQAARVPRVKLKMNDEGGVLEIFRRATRFLTVTGLLWNESSTEMRDLDPLIDYLQAEALRQEPPRPPRERRADDGEFIEDQFLREALKFIPADERDIWLRVGMACHTVGLRDVWDDWAQSSAKFDESDQDKTWDAFRDDRADGITIASIFGLARDYGWDPQALPDDAPEDIVLQEVPTPPRPPPSPPVPPGGMAPVSRDFLRDRWGRIIRTEAHNIRWAIQRLGVRLSYNDFAKQPMIEGLAGFEGELTDPGATRLRFLIHEMFELFLPPIDLFREVVSNMAWQHRFHPVQDYLNGVEPRWDGVARIGSWVIDYGGAEDNELNRAFGRLWMIAAVRRIRHPGCKFDTMIILESPQGKDKSKALRALAVHDEWFTDNLDLGADAKVVMEIMAGKWIVEFSELDGMGRREISRIKNFLSKQDDRARMAYGHFPQTHQRQFVCAGTTNEHQYLLDEENRRFLPIKIVCFNTEALVRDRDQLWAEAAHYETLGEPITLDKSLWAAAAAIQAEREIENPFLDALRLALGEADGWITILKLWEIIGIELDQRQKNQRMLGKAMRKLGFERCRVWDNTGLSPKGKRGSVYYIRGRDEPLPMQTLDPEYEQARKDAAAQEARRKLQETVNETLKKNPFIH
jgi:hypothetical protein